MNLRSWKIIQRIFSRRNKWEKKHFLSEINVVVGRLRFTVKQYEYTRNMLRDLLPDETEIWPPYSTIQRCFKNILYSSMPESSTVRLRKKLHATNCENEFQSGPEILTETDETAPVKISTQVFAKLDVSTTQMYDDERIPIPSSGSSLRTTY